MTQDLTLWIADALVILGVVIMSIGVYGMAWMPDAYTRIHAASKSVFLGVIPMLLALTLLGDPAIMSRSLLIAIFLLLTTPVAAHAIGRAAYMAGERLQTPGAVDESGREMTKRRSERVGDSGRDGGHP